MLVRQSFFTGMKGTLFNFSNETDKKGYYNVEKINFINNSFRNNNGQLLTMLRGGNDESTMGPLLTFSQNTISNCNSGEPLIYLYGTQYSTIEKNTFTGSNKNATLIKYEDAVRAMHVLQNNRRVNSGETIKNKYVSDKNNREN
jgi:poly(beta-D-mannuronate) lyase